MKSKQIFLSVLKSFICIAIIGYIFAGCTQIKSNNAIENNYTTEQSTHSPSDKNDDFGMPAALKNRKEIIIHHKGYITSYNPDWKMPNWVAWELTANELNGNEQRASGFSYDPAIKGTEQAESSDYSRSGYSRGHMAPASDFKWGRDVMNESFYLSNICPQDKELNAGDWNELENQCRFWVRRDKSLWIVAGPIVSKNPAYIGKKHKIAVPNGFFKVVLAYDVKEPRMIGFIYENRNKNIPMRDYAMSVDEVEKRTGIDFFPALPDKIENKLESENSVNRWRWPMGKRK